MYASQQPRDPQRQGGPSKLSGTCPNSPAVLSCPRTTWPLITTPAPTPSDTVTYTKSPAPSPPSRSSHM